MARFGIREYMDTRGGWAQVFGKTNPRALPANSYVRSPMEHGTKSILSGASALLAGVAGWHAERVRIPGSAHVLNWLSEHGLVRAPKAYASLEMAPAGTFLLTDGGAIQLIQVLAWLLAAAAMLFALAAERRREESGHASAGLLLGFLTISFSSAAVAVCAGVASAVAVGWMRRER
jgi:hypothetical protein